MKTIDWDKVGGTLAECLDNDVSETLILMRDGRPVAAVVPLENTDAESASLSTNPRFLALIERSRASRRQGLAVDSAAVRRQLGLDDEGD